MKLSPGHIRYRLRTGMAWFKAGQYAKARPHWEAAKGDARAQRYLKLLEKKGF